MGAAEELMETHGEDQLAADSDIDDDGGDAMMPTQPIHDINESDKVETISDRL